MKALNELPMEQIKNIILNTKAIKEEFENYICECEMDWIEDKLKCVKSSLSNWSIGTYQHSYINVDSYNDFVDGVEECIESFGSTESLERLVKHAQKLKYTNLFEHYAEKIEQQWFDEEITPIIKGIEDCGYHLYNGEITDDMEYSYLECFVDNMCYPYIYDEETNKVYRQIA